MRRILFPLALLALASAVVAVGYLFLRPSAAPLPSLPTIGDRTPAPAEEPSRRVELVRGGIYAGVVRDEAGAPIPGATVWLVGYETGERLGPSLGATATEDGDAVDLSQLPSIGFETAAEGKTDAAGRFRIAADAESAIRIVAAHRAGYMPELVAIGGPREDLAITLEEAGQVVGRVVDAESGDAVPGAKVTIYLQQRALVPTARPGERAGGAPEKRPLSPFAVAQRWVAESLGTRIWGLTTDGEPGLTVLTDGDGVFRFGPVGDAVQLEFVITHPDYMWIDFDNTDGESVRRMVVGPGETVERTFELVRGKEISGRVVDESTGRGVADVLVEVEHVVPYKQHWWNRDKKRRTRTKRDGSFRVAGLSFGPYIATLRPPTGGMEFIPSIPEGATDVVWEIGHRGAIEGRVVGFETAPKTVTLVLEARGDATGGRQRVLQPRLGEGGTFTVTGVRPGAYLAWVKADGRSSLPQPLDVIGQDTTAATFEIGGGGVLALEVVDDAGRIVDPVQVVLLRLGGEPDGEVALGTLVTRRGRLLAEALAPGRYRVRLVSPEALPTASDPFDILDGRTTNLGTIELPRRAWLQIRGVRVGAGGPRSPGVVDLAVREGAEGDFRPLPPLKGQPVPIRPGTVTVRAQSSAGLAFERTFDVGGGETVDVDVVLREE